MEEGVKEPQEKGGAGRIVLNVVGIVLCVIFIPVIIMNLVLIVKSYTSPDEIPSVFGISPVIVLSGSMSPTFETGDMIFLQKTDPNTLKQDDIICFRGEDGESVVTHRIMEVQQSGGETLYVTQGDANNTEDRTAVQQDQVQGKYTGLSIPGLGNLAVFMQSPAGMVVFIVGPLLLFVLWDILRRALASRKKAGQAKQMEEELERLRAQVQQNGAPVPGPSGPEDHP